MQPRADSVSEGGPALSRQEVSHSALYLAIRVAGLAGLGLSVIVAARGLGPDDYGKFAFTVSLLGIVGIFSQLGQQPGSVALYARGSDPRVLARQALITCLALSPVAAAAVVVSKLAWGPQGSDVFQLAVFATIGVPAYALVGVLTSLLVVSGRPLFAVSALAASACVYATTLGILALLSALTVISAVAAWSLAWWVALSLALLALRGVSTGGSHASLKMALRTGLSLLPASVGLFMILRANTLAIGIFSSPAVVASYAIGVAILEAALALSESGSAILSARQARGSIGSRRSATETSARLSVLIALVVAVLMAALAPIAVPAVFGVGFTDAVLVVVWLAPGVVALSLARAYSVHVLATESAAIISRVIWGTLAISVALAAVMSYFSGAAGAAAASSVAFAVLAGAYRVLFQRSRTDIGIGAHRDLP